MFLRPFVVRYRRIFSLFLSFRPSLLLKKDCVANEAGLDFSEPRVPSGGRGTGTARRTKNERFGKRIVRTVRADEPIVGSWGSRDRGIVGSWDRTNRRNRGIVRRASGPMVPSSDRRIVVIAESRNRGIVVIAGSWELRNRGLGDSGTRGLVDSTGRLFFF